MQLDDRSLRRLAKAHPDLARVIVRASEIHPVQFIVTEVDRTVERQRELVVSGASKTMDSRHVPKWVTGLGGDFSHAVDLAVKIGSEVRWDGALYIDLAESVAKAATHEGVSVTWGGAWVAIREGMDLGAEQAKYAERKRKEGKRPFIDGPHFELDRKVYP